MHFCSAISQNMLLRHLSLRRDRGVQHSVKELNLRHFHGFLNRLNGGNSALRHNRQSTILPLFCMRNFDSLQHLLYHRACLSNTIGTSTGHLQWHVPQGIGSSRSSFRSRTPSALLCLPKVLVHLREYAGFDSLEFSL